MTPKHRSKVCPCTLEWRPTWGSNPFIPYLNTEYADKPHRDKQTSCLRCEYRVVDNVWTQQSKPQTVRELFISIIGSQTHALTDNE